MQIYDSNPSVVTGESHANERQNKNWSQISDEKNTETFQNICRLFKCEVSISRDTQINIKFDERMDAVCAA